MTKISVSLPSLHDLKRSIEDLLTTPKRIYLDSNLFIPDFLDHKGVSKPVSSIYWVLDDFHVNGRKRREIINEVMDFVSQYTSMLLNSYITNERVVLIRPVADEILKNYESLEAAYKKWDRHNRKKNHKTRGNPNYSIDKRGWQRNYRAISEMVSIINDSKGRVLSIEPNEYDYLLNIVSPMRRFCKNRSNGNDVDERLICYGYLDAINHVPGTIILSDDGDLYILFSHSYDVISRAFCRELDLLPLPFKKRAERKEISLY